MKNLTRHQCSCCNRKIYEVKMYRYYYPLLKRTAWHCEECVKFVKWGFATAMIRPALGED